MPAQPQNEDQQLGQNASVNNSDANNIRSGINNNTNTAGGNNDPYTTLRAEKVSSVGNNISNDSNISSTNQLSSQQPTIGGQQDQTQVSSSNMSTFHQYRNMQNNFSSKVNNSPVGQTKPEIPSQSPPTMNKPIDTGDTNVAAINQSTVKAEDKDFTSDLPEGVQLVDDTPAEVKTDSDNKQDITAKAKEENDPSADLKMEQTDSSDEKIKELPDEKSQDVKPSSKADQEDKDVKTKSEDDKSAQKEITITGTTTLADVLAQMGTIDSDKAEEVKLAEVKSGNSQEEILKGQNLATDKQIAKAKAKLYKIEFIDLSAVPVDPETLNLIPQRVAEKFKIFPVSRDVSSNKLIVAMADPLNLTAIEFIEQRTGMTVEPKAGDPTEIENLITAGYTTSLAKEVSEALKDVSQERRKVRTLDAGRTGLIREEKVAEVVTHILGFAVKSRASDIHIEPQEHATRVRYRIDGILQEKLTIPKELHDALVSRIKILSGMKIDEKRVPQDGRFAFKSDVEEVDLRVSTLPTAWGEKIVMRLLKKSGGIPELPELGLRGRALKNLQEAILRPHGIILITGPTGSGKTTTLYSIIQKINTPKVNIMTLEDPVEYKIHGVNQVQANPAAGLTFASGMRSFLRQDPNIILVGEIRDEETAELAIQASLTGHLVFSTLHTNSAAGALPRLLDMGAEPYLLASSITAIVGQRVVRKIHEECKTAYVPDPKVIDDVKDVLGKLWQPKPGEIEFYKGQGDQDCNNSGYHGRVGIFEVLPVSEKIGRLILEQAPSGDIDKQAKEEGMITMKQDGYQKVVEGITTIEEVLRVAQE